MIPTSRPFYHFSVDDVLATLVNVSDRGGAVTREPLFASLAELHACYGTHTDLYLFAEQQVGGRRRSLAEISERQCSEYEALAWLRLGPHAWDALTPPHAQTPSEARATFAHIYAQIARFAGTTPRSRWLRLHQFSECFECADFLQRHGVEALLLTDKEVQAHRLPPAARDEVRRRGHTHFGLEFVRSHLRLESLARSPSPGAIDRSLEAALAQHGFVVLFTHETDMNDARVRDVARACAAFFARRGVPSI
ncbi:MAG: hypothetical protein R3F56_25175 [Planctomycetota bacterium]